MFQTGNKTTLTPPESPKERLRAALDLAWEVTKAKFRDGQIRITKEAPLQHQYAQALNQLGDLFTTHRREIIRVDLERLESNLVTSGHDRYLDVVCELDSPQREEPLKAAVEMKFKPGSKGAPQGSVQAMYDLYSLEVACNNDYDMGRLLIAANNKYYWQEPQNSEIRENFGIYQGRSIRSGDELVAETSTAFGVLESKTQNSRLSFQGNYEFDWNKVSSDFHFLSVAVDSP